MSALFFALLDEAKPWIEALELKPASKQGHFRFYQNEKHTAVVSGPGKLAMAMAVTELAFKLPKEKRHPGYRVWNLGICGSNLDEFEIGSFFWANVIRDQSQQRDYFPDRIEKITNHQESKVTTFDRPISTNQAADKRFYELISREKLEGTALIDMECSGFFEAASIYFELHQIQVGKIISDHLEGKLCKASLIIELMREIKKDLIPHFLSDSSASFSEVVTDEEWSQVMIFAKKQNFTESMLVDIKKSILYFKFENRNLKIPFPKIPERNRPIEKRDVKETFQKWRALLHV